jgi:CRP-like cAMP-binding protein
MQATNSLLAQLPPDVLLDLAPHLVSVDLEMGQALFATAPVWQVYFPVRCVVSVLASIDGPRSLEVALVGREGLAGFPLVGSSRQPLPAIVQRGGAAMRLPGEQLLVAMSAHPPLHAAVHQHAGSLMMQMATNAGCNHFHQLEPRLARRLLIAGDHAGGSTFAFTQDFLASLLAVRRVGICEAASSLQRRGLIQYHRGQMTILDQAGLEAAACGCSRDALGTAPHRPARLDGAFSAG